MNYTEKYERFWSGEDMNFKKRGGYRMNDKAIKDLELADLEEVFMLECYLEGVFVYENEDRNRSIEFCFKEGDTAGANFFQYMKIKDFLDFKDRFQFIQINQYK